MLNLTHTTSGTPAAGIGTDIAFTVETTAGNEKGMILEALTTDVTSGQEDFDFVLKLMEGGSAAAERMRITSEGNLTLPQYNSVLTFGTNSTGPVSLTHEINKLIISGTDKLAFGDDGTFIQQSSDSVLDLTSDGSINMNVGSSGVLIKGTNPKLTIGDAGEEDTMLVFDGYAIDYRVGLDDSSDKLEIGVGSSMGTTTALTVDSNQQVKITATTESTSTSTGSLIAAGGVGISGNLHIGGNIIIPDSGDIGSTTIPGAINISNTGLVDVSSLAINGTTVTSTASELNLVDGITAGTASASKALILDSSKNIASLGTIGSGAITSTGDSSFEQITVDNIVINDKSITMTGSTDDTATFTVADNGALTIQTVDTAAAAANINISADGTNSISGTTVTLDSAGDIVLDADSEDIILKDNGTTYGAFSQSSGELVIKSGTTPTIGITLDGANVDISGNLRIPDSGTIGSLSSGSAISISSSGLVDVNSFSSQSIKLTGSGSSANGIISDPSGNELLDFFASSSAVNYLRINNSDTGSGPSIKSLGDDNDIDLNLHAKGTGVVKLTTNTDRTLAFDFDETATGINTIFKVSSTTSDRTLTFPDATTSLVGNNTTQTLSNKTLTEPKFINGGFIADANGAEMIKFATVGSAVNNLKVSNAATTNGPTIEADGDDTDIDLNLSAKGSGNVLINSSEVITASSTVTLTNKTLTAPKIADGGKIIDPNGNEFLTFSVGDASAVNHLKIANNAASSAPSITADGDDTNIDINLVTKGTGVIKINGQTAFTAATDSSTITLTNKTLDNPTIIGTALITDASIKLKNGNTSAGFIEFFENSDNGTNKIIFKAPEAITSDITITLPDAGGSFLTALSTDTLENKTLTEPKFAHNGFIADASGAEILIFDQSNSAVNQITMKNSATGNAVSITASGDDAAVGLNIQSKGTGTVNITNAGSAITLPISATTLVGTDTTDNLTNKTLTSPTIQGTISIKDGDTGPGHLDFYEDSDFGTNTITLSAPSGEIASSFTLTLPIESSDTLVGKATTDTLTNKTLTAPKFADNGYIADASGLELIKFSQTTTAVNEITVANAATGSGPTISTTGGDTNIDLNLESKGDGNVIITSNSDRLLKFDVASKTDAGTLTLSTDLVSGSKTLKFPNANTTLVGISNTQTLSNKTLTEPMFADNGFIADVSGLELIKFSQTTTAVNEITVANAATSNGPTISATGDDTDIDLNLHAKGTGVVKLTTNSDRTLAFDFDETASGINTIFKVSSDTSDKTITFPNATDTLVGKATTDVLTNKTLTDPVIQGTIGIKDGDTGPGHLDFYEDSDNGTNTISITAPATIGSSYVLTLPIESDDTLVGKATTDTLTNKTLTSPVIQGTIAIKDGNTGPGHLDFYENSDNGTNTITLTAPATIGSNFTLTLPIESNDTLVGKATTDTLTNKTLTNPSINEMTFNGIVTLTDNSSASITFDAPGKTGILAIDTTDSSEKVTISNDLHLTADDSILKFGTSNPVSITHSTNRLLINSANKLAFGDINTYIYQYNNNDLALVSDNNIILDANSDIKLDANGNDILLDDDGTTFGVLSNSSGELVIKSGSTSTTAITLNGANVTIAGTLSVGSSTFSETELSAIDTVTAGTASASKALILDSSKDINGINILTSNTMIVNTEIKPDAQDGATLGSDVSGWSDLYLADGGVVYMGNDQDVSLTHNADTGITLSATTDATNGVKELLNLTHTTSGTPAAGIGTDIAFTVETTAGNEKGMILEALTTDVTSGQEDFDFVLKLMEGGSAAAERMRITSEGNLTLPQYNSVLTFGTISTGPVSLTHDINKLIISGTDKLAFGDDGTYIYQSTDSDLQLVSDGTITLNSETDIILDASGSDIILKDDGTTFGSLTNNSSNLLIKSGTTTAITCDSSNVSIAGSMTLGDSRSLTFGSTDPVVLTHSSNQLLISNTDKLAFGDSGTYIQQSSDGVLDLTSDGSINMNVGSDGVVIKGTTPKLTIGDAGEEDTMLVFDGNSVDYRVGLDDGNDQLELGVGSTMGTTTALTIDSNQQVKITATTTSTSTTTGSLVSAGGIGSAGNIISGGYGLFTGGIIPASSGGASLGSSSAEWLGLYLNDAAKIYMGDDQEVTITHNADTGITLSATTDATNGVKELLNLTHTTSGTPAAGIGSDIAFTVETAADNNEKGMILEALTTDVTSGQEDFDFVLKLMEGGASAAEKLRVSSAGLTTSAAGFTSTAGPITATYDSANPVCTLTGGANTDNNALLKLENSEADAAADVAISFVAHDKSFAFGYDGGNNEFALSASANLGTNIFKIGTGGDVSATSFSGSLSATDLTGTIDAARMASAQTSITSILATDLKIGEDDETKIDFETTNTINFYANNSLEMVLVENALTPGTNDGTALGSDVSGWSDLFLADGGIINLGNDQDVTLTHVQDTGLLLNGSRQFQFGDSGTYIHQSTDSDLELVSDGTVTINAETDIILDASGSDIVLKDNGSIFGSITNDNGQLVIKSGSTPTTAITCSDSNVTVAGSLTVGSSTLNATTLATISGVTAGTASGSKAVILDATKNITGLGTIGCGAITSTGTSSFAGLNPSSANTVSLGSASKEWADLYLGDEAIVYMGNDQDVTITHNADTGITLSATTDATNGVKELLNLTHTTSGTPAAGIGTDIAFTVETATDNNEKGMILEALTTDVTSGQEDFDFVLKLMEGGSAASEKLRVSSAGLTTSAAGFTSTAGPITATYDSANPVCTLTGGANTDNNALLKLENSEADAAADVAISFVAHDKSFAFGYDGGNNEFALSASANLGTNIFKIGTGGDVSATSFSGSLSATDLTGTIDAARMASAQTSITSILATDLKIGEDNETKIDFETTNTINFYANNSLEMVLVENALTPGTNDGTALGSDTSGWSDLFLADGGIIKFGNDQDVSLTHNADTGITLSASTTATNNIKELLNLTHTTSGTAADGIGSDIAFTVQNESGSNKKGMILEALTTDVTNGTEDFDFVLKLMESGAAASERMRITSSGNLTLSENGSVITLGTSDPVSLTHSNNQLLISGSDKLAFGDSGTYVQQSTDSNLQLVSDGTITLDADTDIILDANGADIILKDNGTQFGSLTNNSSDLVIKSGTTTAITCDTSNVTISGTLGSGAITSTGDSSFDQITIDNIVVNDKSITMTGSTDDTATFTVAENGALTIQTVDTAASAANISITADGTNTIAGTEVTIDSAGDIVLDSGGADVTLKDDGTTFGSLSQSSGELVIKSGSTPTTAITFSGANATLAGTLGSGAITSTGDSSFDQITIDNIVVNNKSITMTGSTDDTATFTVAENGALTIQTVDTNAADANISITADGTNTIAGTEVTIDSAGDIVLDSGGADVTLKDDGTTFGSFSQSSGELVIKSGSTPTTAITCNGANVTSAGDLTLSKNSVVMTFGTNSTGPVSLTHGTNQLLISGSDKLAFGDSGTYVQQSTDSNLQLVSDGTITLDADTDIILDSNGADIILKDDGTTFGSFTNSSSNLVVKSGTTTALTFNGANVTISGTLGSGAITSTGDSSFDQITIDNIVINDKSITMTGSTDDTATFTVAENGALTIQTVDTAASAANISITADGTNTIAGTTVTLDSAGDIELDAGGADVILKDDGTTFGSFSQSSGELVIKSGSAQTTAITFSGANTTLGGTLGCGAISTTGDMTIFNDTNNADTSFKIGTSTTECLSIEILNGASNKTAEEIRFSTHTESSDSTHGKFTFVVDDSQKIEIDDDGLTLTNGNIIIPDSGTIGSTTNNSAVTIASNGSLTLSSASTVTNSVTEMLNLTHTTSGTPAAGIGTDIAFTVETADNNNEKGMILEALTTDVTSGQEDFDCVVKLMEGGSTAAERMRVTSDGHLTVGDHNTGANAEAIGQDQQYLNISDKFKVNM